MEFRKPLTRRRLVSVALAGLAATPSTRLAHAGDAGRWLELHNTHTLETISETFRDSAGLVAASLAKLNHLLRDHRAGETAAIDPSLFDLLADLAAAAGREPRYEIISGYRSPTTNAKLAAAGRGVATRSLHMQARAIDVRLRGVDCADLRDLAVAMGRGGVGYYAASRFVHLDTGRVRAWQG
jgi:uncharacterized protein YcbK (DUF882 family)